MAEIDRLYPTGMGFCQVVTARGAKQVHISGQVAVDAEGRLVGEGDLIAQTEQVMKNVQRGLEVGGATFDDLVKITIYVVGYTPEARAQLLAVRNRYIDAASGPASTLIGVQCLVAPEFLIEIEALAVID